MKTTLGPIGYLRALERMRHDVNQAVNEQGAEVLYGDLNYKMTKPGFERGYYQEPIVLEMDTFDDYKESFGPVF